MQQLSMAQSPIQDQFHSDLKSVLRKISQAHLPVQQNSLAIFVTENTLLHNEYVTDFEPKQAEIGTDMSNSNVHRSLRGLQERRIVISDSAGRIGINLNLDEWDSPDRMPRVRRGSKKTASKSKKSKKSPQKKGGSGNSSGSSGSTNRSSLKSSIAVSKSEQAVEESEEVLEEINDFLGNLEPPDGNADEHADEQTGNSQESEEISSKSDEIQEEFGQIFCKTTSQDNKKISCAQGTPAEQGAFFDIKYQKIPPSGGSAGKAESDQNLDLPQPKSQPISSLPEPSPSPLLLPAPENICATVASDAKNPQNCAESGTQSTSVETTPCLQTSKRPSPYVGKGKKRIPISERPFPGSRLTEENHQEEPQGAFAENPSPAKASPELPKNNKFANRPFPYWNSRYYDQENLAENTGDQPDTKQSAENPSPAKASPELPKNNKFANRPFPYWNSRYYNQENPAETPGDQPDTKQSASSVPDPTVLPESPQNIPPVAPTDPQEHAGASKDSASSDHKNAQPSASAEKSAMPDKSPVAKKPGIKKFIIKRKKAAKWVNFGSQPLPVRKREGIPDVTIDDFNTICKELLELSAEEKISIQAGKSDNQRKSRFNPYAFVEQSLNKNRHPEAIKESIQWLVDSWENVNDPWAYGQKILVRQSRNFHESSEIKAHDQRMEAMNRFFHPEVYEKKEADPGAPENCAAGGNA